MNKRYEDLEELMSTGEAREVKRAMAVMNVFAWFCACGSGFSVLCQCAICG
ncbi:hypothetical protein [Thioflexithrix psekupsensis]|uniref:hypothetical protein n=1 Tax=Thioflexithrix psekupsensis TaxID=1570016 RepID=UPI00159409D8|nr:hypothetical protein [Thioflexithrix psekupsensis]